ncbi:hypothetical protein ACYZTX_14300 [Pseudomonas sp. MDT1-17]
MPKIISAQDLHNSLNEANEEGMFKLLVASFLMGKQVGNVIPLIVGARPPCL